MTKDPVFSQFPFYFLPGLIHCYIICAAHWFGEVCPIEGRTVLNNSPIEIQLKLPDFKTHFLCSGYIYHIISYNLSILIVTWILIWTPFHWELLVLIFHYGPAKSALNFRTAETCLITEMTKASASGAILYGKLEN